MKTLFESRTLLQLILLGFLAAMLPLAVAILIAIIQSESLASGSRESMVSVQTNADISRQLESRIRELERSARQYMALKDFEILALYRDRHREVRELISVLRNVNSSPDIQSTLDSIASAQDALYQMIGPALVNGIEDRRPSTGNNGDRMEQAFLSLRESAEELLALYARRGQSLANELPRQAFSLRASIGFLAALVIPLSLGLAVLFLALASRPLRQLSRGVRALGSGDLLSPIEVRGARDLVELGQRLDWLRIRLQALEAQKTQFLRNVSHELKTPLTNIREASGLLLEGPQSLREAEVTTVTRVLHENSLRLQALIEELLRFGEEDSRDGEGGLSALSLKDVVAETVRKQGIAAQARDIQVHTQLQSLYVSGNARKLEIIVDNLLSNAIKFTPRGGEVGLTLTQHHSEVHLDVIDSGPGIAPRERKAIFDWFVRGSAETNTVVDGTGMGLAIASEFARQHGGSLELLNSSAGAHFRLTLNALEDKA